MSPKRSLALRAFALAGLACAAACLSRAGAEPGVYPTKVTRYDPARAYNSYILFDGRDGRTHLIDMDGNDVHTWNHTGFPSLLLDPRLTGGRRGHILVQLRNSRPKAGPAFGTIFDNIEIGELNWNGRVVWRWGQQAPGGAARQNHDWQRLANGDTLIVASAYRQAKNFRGGRVKDQVIEEIDRAGRIVWHWSAAAHLEEFGFSRAGLKMIYADQSLDNQAGGFLTINSMNVLGPNRWYAAGDRRFNPHNIMIGARNANVIAIIDRRTGRIVWRLGPYFPAPAHGPSSVVFDYRVPRPVDQIMGAHDPHLIPEGLPGAGDILVLDNEGEAGFPPATLGMFQGSRVLEINPRSRQIVWQYNGEDSDRAVWTFDTSFIGSVNRLPNGNTLICEGMNGRIFQVTPRGRIVWEYVSPYFGRQTLGGRMVSTNWIYRAQPVPYEWVPPGTPREQDPVIPPRNAQFHLPIEKPR